MAEYKQIKIRIWQDNWFLSLTPEEKILWIFLLTNQSCHISGLYEIPKPLISPLTGIKNWEKIIDKFVKNNKILYKDDWIFIMNYQKHQPISNNIKDNVNKAISKYLKEHSNIFAKLKENPKPLASPLPDPCNTLPEIKIESKNKSKNKSKILQKNKIYKMPNFLEDNQKHIQIIGLYVKAKNINCKNQDQQQSLIKRNLRPARNLTGYEFDKIIETMKYLVDNADFKWTLETVGKFIDEDLDKLKKLTKSEDDIIKDILNK